MSPVVGIVLVVALTILLAATAGSFLLGLSDETADSSAPTVAFEFDPDLEETGHDTATIQHKSGSTVDPENLYVVVTDASCTGSVDPDGRFKVADDFGHTSDLAAGMSIEYRNTLPGLGSPLCSGGGNYLQVSGATFTVLWESPSGTSRELVGWTAP